MKPLCALLLVLSAPLWAQFAVTSPAAASTVSGTMTFSVAQAPVGTMSVEYVYDGWRTAGVATQAPWAVVIPAGTEYMDGARVLSAIARGADGSALATSAGVAFTISNFGGTGFSFALSGTSGTVSLTISGMPSGATATCFVDGIRSVEPFTDLKGSILKTSYWDEAADTIHWENGHELAPGDPVYYQADVATASAPLVHNTLYYAVPVDRWKFRLATSRANALTNVYIDLGAIGTNTQKFTRRLGSDRWFIQDTTPRTIDSTRLRNGSHVVTCNAYGGSLTNPFFDGSIKPIATYSAALSTANGAVAMELAGPSQIHLTTGGGTYTVVPRMANTDGSFTALEGASIDWSTSNAAVVTVTSAGVVTPVGAGHAWIRMRYSNAAYALDVPVVVQTVKRFRHLSRGGAILSSYSAAESHLVTNLFELGSAYWDSHPTYGLNATGVNTASEALPQDIHSSASTGAFATWWAGFWPPIQTRLNSHNLSSLWIGDNLASGNGLPGLWRILNSATAQANLGTALAALRDSLRAAFIVMKDEVNSTFKTGPQYVSTWATGTAPFTSVSVAADGTITMAYPFFPDWSGLSATGTITGCLSGATTANLNGCYLITAKTLYSVTMVKTDAAEGVYTQMTDPGLRFTAWQDYERQETNKTVTAVDGSCSAPMNSAAANGWGPGDRIGVFGNPTDTDLRRYWVLASLPDANTVQWSCPGVSNGPYTGLTLRLMWSTALGHDALQAFKAQFDATTGRPSLGWPIEAKAGNDALAQWETVSDHLDAYNQLATNAGSPYGHPAGEYYDRYTTPRRRLEARTPDAPLITQISATSGDYRKLTAGDWPRWSADKRTAEGDRPDMLAAGVWAGVAQGAAGFRTYFFDLPSKQAYRKTLALNSTTSPGVNPLWTPELWRSMALSFTLAQRFRELCLSPQITAPSYGRKFVTGARESGTQRMLVVTSFSDNSETLTVDLTEFAYAGGSVARWKVSGKRIAAAAAGGASDTVTLTPGETAIYVFTNGASPLRTYSLTQPLRADATGLVVRYSTWEQGTRELGEAVDCGSGACAFSYDPALPLYGVLIQRAASGAVVEEFPVRLN
jgi:hypothetical protein